MHPIENIMQSTLNELKEMIDVNTIVGDAVVTPDGSTVIPISKVCFGFVSGGGEYAPENVTDDNERAFPFAGGSGAGVSLNPMAFLIVNENEIKLLATRHKNSYEKLVDAVPQILSAIRKTFCENPDQENK